MSMDLPPLPPPASIAKTTKATAQTELPVVKGSAQRLGIPNADAQGLARSQGGTHASSTERRASGSSFLDAFKFSGARDNLSKEAIAQMSLAERAHALRDLVVPFRSTIDTVADSLFGERSVTKDYRLAPAFGPNQKAIVRLLSSAKNAGEFDYLYSRVGNSALMMSVTGKHDDAVRALADKHHNHVKRGDWDSFFPYLETMAGIKSAGKNRIQFLIDGAEALPAMRDDLANNTFEHVIGTVFALQADDIGNRFVDRLGGQVQKGAKVRWMLDEFGTNDGQEVEAKKLMGKMGDLGIDLTVNNTPGTVSELNHRKIAIMTNRTPTGVGTAVGYTGGMNIGVHYQGRGIEGHEHGWHDQTNRVQGPAVALMLEAVLQNWERDGGKPIPAEEIAAMRAACAASPEVPDGVDTWVIPHNGSGEDRNIKYAYLRAMATAKDTIRIANPYWGDRDIIEGLIKAAKDGVDVRVYFPAENDQAIMARTARAAYELLAEAGVKVFEVAGMSHLKVGAFDDVVMAGSSNLDARSLEFNDELNLLWRGRAAAADVQARLFTPDEARSKRITEYDATFREKLNLKLGGWT